MTRAGSNKLAVRGGLMAGVAIALLCSTPAWAQSRQRFELPAGDAAQQVQALAQQSGVQVLAPNADLAGVRTQSVSGNYTPAEALRAMLEGTGLQVSAGTGGALVITAGSQSSAASGSADGEGDERIIVTGSRIERTGVDTIQAASVTDEAEIERRAYTNLIQALSDTPGFAAPANSQIGTSQGQLGVAQSFSNFLGLGSQRTLTLVNGRRFVSSNTVSGSGSATAPGSQVDINLIPVGLVERIETVAIGGAPVYGSDAISGTVNFILKDDYEGIELTGQLSISERGDAANQTVRGLIGHNFMDGRLNLVLGAEYSRQEGMILSNRFPFLALLGSGNTNRTDGIPALVPIQQTFAFFTEGGLPFNSGTLPSDATLITANGLDASDTNLPLQFGNGGILIPFVRGARYNGDSGGLLRNGGDGVDPADHRLLLSPNERYLINALGNFDVTDNINLFFESSYAHTEGTKLSDLFQFAAPAGAGGPSLTFSIDNPYLPAATRATLIANGVTSTFRLNRNLNDIADSEPAVTELDVWRIVLGARGNFSLWGEDLNWDVAYNYGHSRNRSELNQINQTRFLQAIDVVSVGGTIQCRNTANGCIPMNIFGQNSFTPEAAAWVIDQGVGISENALEEWTANLGGRLPFGVAEPIAFSIGVAHRTEEGSFEGNDIINAGLTLLGGAVAFPDAATGGFNTDEAYGEAVVPLINEAMNVPGISRLEFEGAVRYVHHSSTGGDITWSAGGRLNPRIGNLTDGLTLRGVYTRAIRSPSIVELFLAPTPVARAGNDLCAPSRVNSGPNPTVRLANCTAALAAVGGPAPAAFNPTTNVASPFGVIGGNPNLDNEKADSWSVGMVWQPPAIPRLRVSVDYSEVKVRGAISRFTLASAQAACYDSPNFPNEGACDAFRRLTAAEAAAQSAATGRTRVVGDIADGYLESFFNSQSLDFAGVIGEVDYRLPVTNFMSGGDPGSIRFNLKLFHIARFESQVSGAAPILESAGQLGTPKWRINGRIGFSFDPIDFDVNVIWTDNVVLDLLATNEDIADEINRIPSYTLVNTSLGFRLNDQFTLQFSVRNLFDRAVPFGGVVNGAYSVFDPIGRTYTATASVRF